MRTLTLHIGLLASVGFIFNVACANKSTTGSPPIRMSWRSSQHELFAYVIRPARSNFCEVAVVSRGRTLEGPVVNRTLSELLSLVQNAHKQVAAKQQPNLVKDNKVNRLVVTYNSDGNKSFSIQGSTADLLKSFRDSPALEELLLLTSRDQPKNYRMLDEPRPGGPFMKPPKTD